MKNHDLYIVFSLLILVVFTLTNISLGSVYIPVKEVFKILFQQSENETWQYIILDYRLPKAITSIFVGSGLALSGLLMQNLFRNPLAGPYILGISSGASLGVALVILGSSFLGSFLLGNTSIVIASSLGSCLVLLAVLGVASKIKDTMAILIIGLMFASFTSAMVSVLSFFSSAESLQKYIFWSFGNLGNISWQEVQVFFICWFIGLLLTLFCIKNLNSLLLGEAYAKSLGVNLKQNKFLVIVATGILAGSTTAFVGPIAFVGLAVPHLTRLVIKSSNHYILIPFNLIFGALIMLVCDSISQLPGSVYTLPINAVTSAFGAPIVIWLLLRKKKLMF
ncbi:iron ABC transporter permease [Mesonia sp. K7]|uniref:FecCD family ABC transporter permease n=1 Tax=Mesonia sp. K7 TaxID=2218606 RepID=UPI000DA89D7A|nr:iron ABC transporter permease [Mesonia sp. K7]PZD77883.1 iron ABC transporter permease [Mesonia sp. K7]